MFNKTWVNIEILSSCWYNNLGSYGSFEKPALSLMMKPLTGFGAIVSMTLYNNRSLEFIQRLYIRTNGLTEYHITS